MMHLRASTQAIGGTYSFREPPAVGSGRDWAPIGLVRPMCGTRRNTILPLLP
jgi:hypothetical protein